jgi:DNA-binding MarR family transcriptional regulator
MNPPRTAAAPDRAPASTGAASKHGIIRLVNRVRVELIDALDLELAKFDVTAADSPARLCKNISYDPGAMTRMIDRLEQKGLVRRNPNPDDRRATNLEITTAGRALYPQLLAAKELVQSQFLRGFSEQEVRVLEQLLNRMLENR